MSEFKIDHSKDTLIGSLGFSDKELEELSEKCANISFKLLTGEYSNLSKMVEEIAQTFSYRELLYKNSILVLHTTKDALDSKLVIELNKMFNDKKE